MTPREETQALSEPIAAVPVALALSERERAAIAHCRQVLAAKSKSFALATRLLPAWCRDQFAVVYAFCRHVDDAIDLAPAADRPAALATLRVQVEQIFAGCSTGDATLDAFASVARARAIPRLYVDELIAGMEMDVARTSYPSLDSLYLYCHRVAGVVGLLLCHVMGLSDPKALRNAAHLGLAMQLTNICRDVEEDLKDGRVYLPGELLGAPLTTVALLDARQKLAARWAVMQLLELADDLYLSADEGLRALPLRCGFAVRTARLVYAAIGDEVRAHDCDPFRGRVHVPLWKKIFLVGQALFDTLLELPLRSGKPHLPPPSKLRFPRDVLAQEGERRAQP